MSTRSRVLAALAVALPLAGQGAGGDDPLAGMPRALLESGCAEPPGDGEALAAATGATLVDARPMLRNERTVGWTILLESADGDAVELTQITRVARTPSRLAGLSFELRERGPDGARRPALFVAADARCEPRSVRRLRYDAAGDAEYLEDIDPRTLAVRAREPVNPPVPPGADPGGVRVGMVDSGVDYRLPAIASRLARDADGNVVGRDFWDLDDRPFDADSPNPFRARRHGTRTASILLAEAPVASLVPYRYPRPEMSRMADLVAHADAAGVRILNLALGSNDAERWRAFEDAARAHPQMLMVVSAGNDGRDVDRYPVYPAALALDNVLAVTSSEDDGRLAYGSSYGVHAVDVAVPAERRVAVEFGGQPRLVSGSSYAAARISALAACLLAADPGLGADALRAAVLARAQPTPDGPYAAHGFVPEPTAARRGACEAEPQAPEVIAELTRAFPGDAARAQQPAALELRLELVVAEDSGWPDERVAAAVEEAGAILAQCGVHLSESQQSRVRLPRELRYFDRARARRLVDALTPHRPVAFFLADSVERPAFDAVAIGLANAGPEPELYGTAWMTAPVEPAGVALAHELVHLLADSGEHSEDPGNLMYPDTRAGGTALGEAQCARIRERGVALALLLGEP